MARTPNYGQERKERERVKAARKAEKLAAKTEKRETQADPVADSEMEPSSENQ